MHADVVKAIFGLEKETLAASVKKMEAGAAELAFKVRHDKLRETCARPCLLS